MTKQYRLVCLILLALMLALPLQSLSALPAAAAESGSARPVLTGGSSINDQWLQLKFDRPVDDRPVVDGTFFSLPATFLAHVRVGQSGVYPIGGYVYGEWVHLFLNKSISDEKFVDVTIESGATVNGKTIEPVQSFRIATLAGRMWLLNTYDPQGTGFTVQDAVQFLNDGLYDNILGLPGIGKDDVRGLLQQMQEGDEYREWLMHMAANARESLQDPGDRPADAVAALRQQVEAAETVLADPASSPRRIDMALLSLVKAYNTFNSYSHDSVELSSNGQVEGLTVNITDRIVVAPAGSTVADMLSGLYTTYGIKVYPNADSATESTSSDLITSAMKIKVSTSPETVYGVQLLTIADNFEKVTAALANPAINVITIKGQIVAADRTLTIDRPVHFRKLTTDASLEVREILMQVTEPGGFSFSSDLFISNASSESELLSRIRQGMAVRIRVANVDGYSGFLTMRRIGDAYFYAGTNGTAYVDSAFSLLPALADASVTRIFLLSNISVPGTLSFPTDRAVTYAASSNKSIYAASYANVPDASRLDRVTITLPEIEELAFSPASGVVVSGDKLLVPLDASYGRANFLYTITNGTEKTFELVDGGGAVVTNDTTILTTDMKLRVKEPATGGSKIYEIDLYTTISSSSDFITKFNVGNEVYPQLAFEAAKINGNIELKNTNWIDYTFGSNMYFFADTDQEIRAGLLKAGTGVKVGFSAAINVVSYVVDDITPEAAGSLATTIRSSSEDITDYYVRAGATKSYFRTISNDHLPTNSAYVYDGKGFKEALADSAAESESEDGLTMILLIRSITNSEPVTIPESVLLIGSAVEEEEPNFSITLPHVFGWNWEIWNWVDLVETTVSPLKEFASTGELYYPEDPDMTAVEYLQSLNFQVTEGNLQYVQTILARIFDYDDFSYENVKVALDNASLYKIKAGILEMTPDGEGGMDWPPWLSEQDFKDAGIVGFIDGGLAGGSGFLRNEMRVEHLQGQIAYMTKDALQAYITSPPPILV